VRSKSAPLVAVADDLRHVPPTQQHAINDGLQASVAGSSKSSARAAEASRTTLVNKAFGQEPSGRGRSLGGRT
jgi:hypothetical protein